MSIAVGEIKQSLVVANCSIRWCPHNVVITDRMTKRVHNAKFQPPHSLGSELDEEEFRQQEREAGRIFSGSLARELEARFQATKVSGAVSFTAAHALLARQACTWSSTRDLTSHPVSQLSAPMDRTVESMASETYIYTYKYNL